jgi:hypothetical protein
MKTLEKLSETIKLIEGYNEPNNEINIVGIRNELQKRFPKKENEDELYKTIRTYQEQLTSQINSKGTGISNRYGALLMLKEFQKEYSN